MTGRKVFVNFISLKSPFQVKCELLPESERRSDFIVLRELLFKAMMLDKSILVLGGREASNVEDILILQYDEDFGDIIDVNHDVVFYHKQKDVVVKLRKNCPNEEMSTITSFSFNGREENDVASGFPEPGIIENLGKSEHSPSSKKKFFCDKLNKGKDASSELHDVTDNHKSDCELIIMINDFNISFLVNLENDVSDSRELLSYAVIDGVKHTAVLVKFDETDVDAVKINVLTHNELFDVFHTQSDGNYAACSSDSEYESTDCISGTDHGDAQSLNKSPRQKRKQHNNQSAASTAVFFEGEKGTIGLLMAINRLCSTKKGTSSSAELFEIAQVNMRVEPSYKGINARALLFFDDHDYLQSMLIICGTARNFKNIPVTKSWQAVFKLLSVYYVFDGNYPALYGVLSVIERRCISQLLNTSITVDPKDSSSLKVFIRKFNAFMKNS
ncbi:Uncharacterized protein APZ42_032116 [Daphnia magna]|uniref:Uncharacterized protein n=1 Tax=Daphnia magna TaxID=35525 RepID=A0A164M9D2_9CRUS|nr:Uncharacterized protein APZ42_032116 [Daphnia magna]